MQLLDQVFDGQQYTVRIWRDEVAPDAIDEYTWVAYQAKLLKSDGSMMNNPQTKIQYESSQIDQAKSLSQLNIPPVSDPTVVKQDIQAIADQQAAVDAQNASDDESDTEPNV